MPTPDNALIGQFCWVDLAAVDAAAAIGFYTTLFGWTTLDRRAGGGHFTRLQAAGRDVGSLYQLHARHLNEGVPSHWTAYIRVDEADATARRAVALGGAVVVRPFTLPGTARIAVILDAVGAPIGLWQTLAADQEDSAHG